MKKNLLTLSVLGALTMTPAFALAGEGETENTDASAKPEAPAELQALDLAAQLEAIGTENQDALLLAAALRLQSSVDVEQTEREKASEGEATADGDKDESTSDLAALASEFAGENEALHAVIAMAGESSASRGRVGGAAYHTDRVLAHTTDVYNISFRGGQSAYVSIDGDGDTDLDLYIYDENGYEICSSVSYSDNESCSWTPRWTGSFTVKIENLGGVWNQYDMVTN